MNRIYKSNVFRSVYKSSKGAIDLASIMVGIIIIGLVGGVIAATVFAVIPWAQDNVAKQQLNEVVTAQSVYALGTTDGTASTDGAMSLASFKTTSAPTAESGSITGYGDYADLTADGLLQPVDSLYVVSTNGTRGYHAESKSGTGRIFYIDLGDAAPRLAANTTTHWGTTDGNGNVTSDAPPAEVEKTVTTVKGAFHVCDSGNACYYMDASVTGFSQGDHDIVFYCDGALRSAKITVGADGNGSVTPTAFCGFSDAYVTVDGIESNHVDFRQNP